MVSNIFNFHPYLGKIPSLTNIFQLGWNHQLDIVFQYWVLSFIVKINNFYRGVELVWWDDWLAGHGCCGRVFKWSGDPRYTAYGKKYVYIYISIEIIVLMILRFLFNVDIRRTNEDGQDIDFRIVCTYELLVMFVKHFADLLKLSGHLFEIGSCAGFLFGGLTIKGTDMWKSFWGTLQRVL